MLWSLYLVNEVAVFLQMQGVENQAPACPSEAASQQPAAQPTKLPAVPRVDAVEISAATSAAQAGSADVIPSSTLQSRTNPGYSLTADIDSKLGATPAAVAPPLLQPKHDAKAQVAVCSDDEEVETLVTGMPGNDSALLVASCTLHL